MVRRQSAFGASHLLRLRAVQARNLCFMAKQVSHDLARRDPVCRRLVEALSEFGRDDPEAKIRARACGCPVRGS